jgi:hypothetical protein
VTAAYDRATESVRKYIETTNASAQSVGDSVAEQEKLRVNATIPQPGRRPSKAARHRTAPRLCATAARGQGDEGTDTLASSTRPVDVG